MKNFLNRARNFVSHHANAVAVSVAAGVGVIGMASVAGATGTPIEDTFTSTKAALTTELGYGVALVVALLLIGLGVRMLIKWSKKGVSAG